MVGLTQFVIVKSLNNKFIPPVNVKFTPCNDPPTQRLTTKARIASSTEDIERMAIFRSFLNTIGCRMTLSRAKDLLEKSEIHDSSVFGKLLAQIFFKYFARDITQMKGLVWRVDILET